MNIVEESRRRVRKSTEQTALETVAFHLGIKLKTRADAYVLTLPDDQERELTDIELDALSSAFDDLSRASRLNADFNEPNPEAP